jgi:hypothetical protein
VGSAVTTARAFVAAGSAIALPPVRVQIAAAVPVGRIGEPDGGRRDRQLAGLRSGLLQHRSRRPDRRRQDRRRRMIRRRRTPTRPRLIAALLGFEALTLSLISALHSLGGGSKPFDPTAAGTAETLIGAALASGAVALIRDEKARTPDRARSHRLRDRRLPRRSHLHGPGRRRDRHRLPRRHAPAPARHADRAHPTTTPAATRLPQAALDATPHR